MMGVDIAFNIVEVVESLQCLAHNAGTVVTAHTRNGQSNLSTLSIFHRNPLVRASKACSSGRWALLRGLVVKIVVVRVSTGKRL